MSDYVERFKAKKYFHIGNSGVTANIVLEVDNYKDEKRCRYVFDLESWSHGLQYGKLGITTSKTAIEQLRDMLNEALEYYPEDGVRGYTSSAEGQGYTGEELEEKISDDEVDAWNNEENGEEVPEEIEEGE